MHPGGEIAAAKRQAMRTVYILSTISGHKLENVKAATKGPRGISSISWVAALPPKAASTAPAAPASPRWSSLWTRPSPECANAIHATA